MGKTFITMAINWFLLGSGSSSSSCADLGNPRPQNSSHGIFQPVGWLSGWRSLGSRFFTLCSFAHQPKESDIMGICKKNIMKSIFSFVRSVSPLFQNSSDGETQPNYIKLPLSTTPKPFQHILTSLNTSIRLSHLDSSKPHLFAGWLHPAVDEQGPKGELHQEDPGVHQGVAHWDEKNASLLLKHRKWKPFTKLQGYHGPKIKTFKRFQKSNFQVMNAREKDRFRHFPSTCVITSI